MQKLILGGLALASLLLPAAGYAQTYPTQTVSVTVPFSAGGSNDTIARYMAERLSASLGQPFVVENRPGGGTAVGAAHVANAAPDGNNILFVSGSYTINAATRSDLPFDPVEDLEVVAMAAWGDIGIVSGPRTPINSLEDLVREANSKELFYATAGVGSQQHFFAEYLTSALGIKMTAVPYPGGAEGLIDLLGGRVDLVVGTVSGLLTTIENGAVPVAVMSDERVSSLPDTPTVVEAGYPEATTATYWTVLVPDGTPDVVVKVLHDGITDAFNSDEGKAFLASLDARPANLSSEDAQAHITEELAHWTELATQLNIRQ